MADRIGVISGGKLVAEGTLDEFRSRFGTARASLEDMFLAIVHFQFAVYGAGRSLGIDALIHRRAPDNVLTRLVAQTG